MRLIVVGYPERRLNFFKEQLAAANRRLDWSMKHNPDCEDHAEKGEVVSFYEWAVKMAEVGTKPRKKQTRPVVRVDDTTGNVVRFPSVTAASESIGINLSMALLTNRPLKGYRFYYEEDWKDGDSK